MDNNRDGFLFATGPLNKDTILVESERLEEYVPYIRENHIESIYIYSPYYTLGHVDFLSELEGIVRKVNIRAPIIRFDGLYGIKDDVIDLRLNDVNSPIDLTVFRSLATLCVENVNSNILSLERCTQLKSLHLWQYRPKSNNLEQLAGLRHLEELSITQSPVTSLSGCENLQRLKKVELNYLGKLESIEALAEVPSLKELTLESCRNVDFSVLNRLTNLSKLSLVNCGELNSLSFVQDLTCLEFLIFFKTTIVDGDLSFCEGIGYVGFNDKKHYTHKMKDF